MSRDKFDELIDRIYTAAVEPQGWAEVLRAVTELVSGSCAGRKLRFRQKS
jgi:hypothetical protein